MFSLTAVLIIYNFSTGAMLLEVREFSRDTNDLLQNEANSPEFVNKLAKLHQRYVTILKQIESRNDFFQVLLIGLFKFPHFWGLFVCDGRLQCSILCVHRIPLLRIAASLKLANTSAICSPRYHVLPLWIILPYGTGHMVAFFGKRLNNLFHFVFKGKRISAHFLQIFHFSLHQLWKRATSC